MTLGAYIEKRNGVPMGHSKSLSNNLYRSFGARSFAVFWTYWNPIFGYYLGTRVYKPLKNFLPAAIALVLTFIFCGMVHDLVTTVVRGDLSLFFSIWFAFMGNAVLVSKGMKQDLSHQPWILRALANLLILGACFGLTYYLHNFL